MDPIKIRNPIKDKNGNDGIPPFVNECCIHCADWIPGKNTETILDSCNSEEIKKHHWGKPFDLGLLARTTCYTGCRFFREKKSLEQLARETMEQLCQS